MADPRLPQPGSDKGVWGQLLNQFLEVEHNPNGTLKQEGSLASKYTKPAEGIPKTDLADDVQQSLENADSATAVPDANASTKGKLRLTGDLGGTADSPTVPSLSDKVSNTRTVNGHALSSDVVVTKGDVGLGAVNNTSDADKPVSTDTQTALNAKAPLNNPTFTGTVTVPTPANDTDAATKAYVDSNGGGGSDDALLKANNLSDLTNAGTARTNLGLGGSATLAVGTGTNTVAAGNDSRITGALQRSTFTANSIVKSDSAGSPAALTVGASTIVGRKDTGSIVALTPAEARDVIDAPAAEDITKISANTQIGTTYTLTLADAGRVIELDNLDPVTLYIPTNATVAFPIGTVVELWQAGSGQVTVEPNSGVVVNSPGGKLKLAVQFSSAALRKRDLDEWVLTGDIAL